MTTPETLPAFDAECFLISPIGTDGSPIRDRADGVMDYIVTPAAAEVGLTVVRADRIAKPGQITRQVIEHVVGARAAVVDLTNANPNVYYESAATRSPSTSGKRSKVRWTPRSRRPSVYRPLRRVRRPSAIWRTSSKGWSRFRARCGEWRRTQALHESDVRRWRYARRRDRRRVGKLTG
jgi:hypothetical protein